MILLSVLVFLLILVLLAIFGHGLKDCSAGWRTDVPALRTSKVLSLVLIGTTVVILGLLLGIAWR